MTSPYENLLLPLQIRKCVTEWLFEDIPSFDYGGSIVGTDNKVASLYCKDSGVLAGVPFVNQIFVDLLHCKVEWIYREGDFIDLKQLNVDRVVVAVVTGAANSILQGERVALNILARASGIASRAKRLKAIAKNKGWNGCVAGTRKTTPGFRLVEKYAMIVGGCDPHRYDLSGMIMLKDNHIWASGSINSCVQKAKYFTLKVEVEVRDEAEALEALEAGADVIMLDNFSPSEAQRVGAILKAKDKKVLVEVSGGLGEDNISQYMFDSIDILSCGSLSQSVSHIDYSLKINK